MAETPSPQQPQQPSLPHSIAGLSPEQGQQVLDAILAGQKIQAIKLYRSFTNSGLKEAKDAVEEIASHLPPGSRPKAGCGSAVLLLAMGLTALAYGLTR